MAQGTRDVVAAVESPGVEAGNSYQRGVPVSYPMLTDHNFAAWTAKMTVLMKLQDVWDAVDGEKTVSVEKDRVAFAAIAQAIPDSVMLAVAEKKTAKEAWSALKEMHIGEERVKTANALVLRRELDRLIMGDNETIAKFTRKMMNTVNEIRSLGCEMKDREVIEKLFRAILDSFMPIISTIQQWGDLNT